MTLPGARQRMKDNKEATLRNFEIVERLRSIREELIGMKEALDAFTYEDVEALKENLMKEPIYKSKINAIHGMNF